MLDLVVAVSPSVAALLVVTIVLCSLYKYDKLHGEPGGTTQVSGDSDLFASALQREIHQYREYEDADPDLEEALLGNPLTH